MLDQGKHEFQCPVSDNKQCCIVWDYDVIRRILVLTEEEKERFETKLSRNVLNSSSDQRTCPNCTVFCTRQNTTDKRIKCLMCKKNGKQYEFCWECLGEWISFGTENCGNTNCCTEEQIYAILREAPGINIIGLEGCPSIRACPKCGSLISHKEICKHMACPCGTRFCFICLKMANDEGYQCGSYNSKCGIAPRQSHLRDSNGYETNNVASNGFTESALHSLDSEFNEFLSNIEQIENRLRIGGSTRTITRETPSTTPENEWYCVIL